MGKNGMTNAVVRDLQTLSGMGVMGAFPDGQLLDRFVGRREDAVFEAIVHRHGPMVWGVCRRVLRDHHDAEDAFQATFLVLARKAASVRPREKLGNWLYGVAYQTAVKARTMRAKRRAREGQVPDMLEPMAVSDDLREALAESLDRELSRLPEKYRIPVVLCDLEGRTHKEAASRLGWPIGTVSSRLSRARLMLAKRLTRRGMSLSGGSVAVLLARESASACVPLPVLSSTIKAVTLGLASQTPATGLISTKVTSLAEEVIRSMTMIKFTAIAVAAGLALGLCGIACAVVGLGRDDKGPGRTATTAASNQEKQAAGQARGLRAQDGTAALLQARPGLAEKGYKASFEELRQTTRLGNVLVVVGKPDQVYRWSVRWLQAEGDLSPKGPGRRAALEAHLKRMIGLQERVEASRALLTDTQKLEAEWYVLEARLWLERAKAE